MTKPRKSWGEKLANSNGLPKIVKLDASGRKKFRVKHLLVPAPKDVDALMGKVPAGKITTIHALRIALARARSVEAACPITTGIFAWIAAHAGDEAAQAGNTRATPWWRTLKSGGELNPKYPGGVRAQRRRLTAEGHRIITRRKRYFVADYESALFEP